VTESADVLVVGGGPAGLAVAIEARMAGLTAVVVDRRRPPVDAACGEGLMPGGVQRLTRLGVELPGAESAVFRGVRYLDGPVVAEARFPGGPGVGVRRTALHRALRERAEDLGADLRWGVKASGLRGDAVATDRGEIRGRWLVAADGRLSLMRRWSGIATSEPARRRFGVRRHYAVPPWSDRVEVHWADDAEAYVTPVGGGVVGVAVLSSAQPLDFDRLLRRFPDLARRLDGARAASRDRGGGPFGQRPAGVVRGRLALVGDAAGSLDPITGEGLSVAFGQAQAVIGAINAGELSRYAAAHHRLMRLPRRLTGLLLATERRPPLRRATIRLLAASPGLFARLVGLVGSAGAGPGDGAVRAPPQATRRTG
jgi:flavin-dependent dehydrogenase